MRIFGINLAQDQDYSVQIYGEDKLQSLAPPPISRMWRKDQTYLLHSIEAKTFASLNGSIGWVGVTASLFSSAFSSRMEQLAPSATIHDLVYQTNCIRLLLRLGTCTRYPTGPDGQRPALSTLVFSDAGRHYHRAQLRYVAGLLVGPMEAQSVFHILSWSSHRCKRPVKSIGWAEILAAGEAIDEGRIISLTLACIYKAEVPWVVVLDSKDLFTSLSTQRNSVDKPIRGDLNVIRHDFEMKSISRMVWVPGNENLADPGTKPDILLTDALRLILHDGRLPFHFRSAESCSSGRSPV